MAPKNKVSVSSEPNTYRLSANERRAARLAEITNKQSDLKREAAERRARRASQDDASVITQDPKGSVADTSVALPTAPAEPGHPG